MTVVVILLCLGGPACLMGWWTLRFDAVAQRMSLLAACGVVAAVIGVCALAVSAEASDVVARYLGVVATMLTAFAAMGGLLIVLRLARDERP